MLRCYEPAHIVGVSKTAYVPATPRCLEWRRDLQPSEHEQRPAGSGFAGCASPSCSSSSRRSPQPSAHQSTASSPIDGCPRRASEHRWPARRGRRCRPRRHDGLRRRDPGGRQARSGAPRRPAPGRDGCRGRRSSVLVDSGWRSPAYQEHLLREAVPKYGSEAEAARWVATPNTSAHVSGDAVDIGPSGAARGCPRTAPRTGCAGSTATSRGTTSCARRPSRTGALPCTPTPRRIRGCVTEELASIEQTPDTEKPDRVKVSANACKTTISEPGRYRVLRRSSADTWIEFARN